MDRGRRNKFYLWETAALLALCAVLLSGVWAQGRQRELAEKVVRLHVIAASDAREDQEMKLRVRDAVLALAEPELKGAANAREAEERLRGLLPELEAAAEALSGGRARAELSREVYPTREYEDFSLPAGMYTSLRVTLGEGQGRNWWCVVYPPLCASAGELQETGALDGDDIRLIREEGTEYEIRFRLLEWWGELAARWDEKE